MRGEVTNTAADSTQKCDLLAMVVTVVASLATLWSTVACATITRGDFSIFGFFETREE